MKIEELKLKKIWFCWNLENNY